MMAEKRYTPMITEAHERMCKMLGLDFQALWDALLVGRYPELSKNLVPRAREAELLEAGVQVHAIIDAQAVFECTSEGAKNALALQQLEQAKPFLLGWERAYAG